MSALKRIFAVVLIATAIVVGVNWMITPTYHDGSNTYPVWKIINWFTGVAVLVSLIVNYTRKRTLGKEASDSPVTREYLEVNLAFYASLLLVPWFFTNFFTYDLFPGNMPTVAMESKDVWWEFIDGAFMLVAGATGFHLWRDASEPVT